MLYLLYYTADTDAVSEYKADMVSDMGGNIYRNI